MLNKLQCKALPRVYNSSAELQCEEKNSLQPLNNRKARKM